jgi:hypothetical protein
MSITQTAIATISKYTKFDPERPEETPATDFSFFMEGFERDSLEALGYTIVGTASISVDLIDRNTMAVNAISSLQKQRDALQYETAKKVADLNDQIKRLQAITHQADVALTIAIASFWISAVAPGAFWRHQPATMIRRPS